MTTDVYELLDDDLRITKKTRRASGNLSGATNATIASRQGIGEILDDDNRQVGTADWV